MPHQYSKKQAKWYTTMAKTGQADTHTHMVSNHIVGATSPEVLSLYNLETSFMHQSAIKTMQLMILATTTSELGNHDCIETFT